MRVWLDNALIIDSWWDSQVHSLTKDVALSAGDHQLKVEYYEAGGKAVAKLSWAAVSTPGTVPISNWKGEYFNNMTLSGTPVLVRDDPTIDFDWGGGSPAWGVVGSDQFSVRWTRSLALDGGTYRFQVTADDGARLWVNGALLVNEWHDAGLTTYTRDIELPAGAIPVTFEYYENAGGAVAKLAWTRLDAGGQWQGQYFANRTLSGSPALTRADAAVNFNWGNGAPATGLPVDDFSVRWTRTMPFTAGQYRFSATSDDGVRIWVNNQLLINNWTDHAQRTVTADITLPGGSLPLVVEYYEHGGGAIVQVGWSYLGATTPPPPPPATTPTGTVLSAVLNVRSGPGLGYAILSRAAARADGAAHRLPQRRFRLGSDSVERRHGLGQRTAGLSADECSGQYADGLERAAAAADCCGHGNRGHRLLPQRTQWSRNRVHHSYLSAEWGHGDAAGTQRRHDLGQGPPEQRHGWLDERLLPAQRHGLCHAAGRQLGMPECHPTPSLTSVTAVAARPCAGPLLFG